MSAPMDAKALVKRMSKKMTPRELRLHLAEAQGILVAMEANWDEQYDPTKWKMLGTEFAESIGGRPDETFAVAFFNAAGARIGPIKKLGIGSRTKCTMHARELFSLALQCDAANFVLAHNHPSGIVEPSMGDRTSVRKLQELGRDLEVDMIDSIIVGPRGEMFSMRNAGICW